jgi:hypothetical protein
MDIHGYICGPRLYEFEEWFFEEGSYGGPWPLRKDGELRKRAGRKFWKMWTKFDAMTDAQKKKCRVGGGCQQF